MIKTNNIAYLVYVRIGDTYDGFYLDHKFITLDKTKAEIWINRFNKIIEDNKLRFESYYESENDYHKMPLFWLDYILEEKPFAYIKEIEIR